MRFILLLCNILVLFTVISGTSPNQYPKDKLFRDDGDPGEALYLTKYIENGDIETAQNLSLVSHPEIPFKSYAGYLTVNKEYNSNLYFWYFPAKVNAADAPVVLYLAGGPGTSGLYCLFVINGPIIVSPTQKVIPREYSWHLNHNLIYIDNPVGTGFSFTDSDKGYANNQIDVGRNLLNALQQFFLLFPDLQKNEFFISGVSYGGKYVPALGYAIHQDNKRQTVEKLGSLTKPKINLKGMAIGSPFSDPVHQFNYADYLYQLGLIDSNGHGVFVKYQNHAIDCIKKRDFECAHKVFFELLGGIPQGSVFHNLTGFNKYYNYLQTDSDKTTHEEFLQKTETRRAIHVGNNPYHDSDGTGGLVARHLKLDFMDSVADWVSELLSHYPILMYSGQLDIIVAYPLTENYLKHLNFSGADEYKVAPRHIWRVDNEVAGYVKRAGNLTDVFIRNAGHTPAVEQPKWVLDMLSRFTHHKSSF